MLAAAPPASEGPVLPMHFQKDRIRPQIFTAIATLGTPQDITLQELRIESFFPMDAETRETFWKWAGSKKTRHYNRHRNREQLVMACLLLEAAATADMGPWTFHAPACRES